MPSGPDDGVYDWAVELATSRAARAQERVAGSPGAVSEPAPTPVEPSAVGKYEALGVQIGSLTDSKNASYGDSFSRSGEILAILYPNGIAVEQYQDALAITRVVDKLFRIASQKDAFGEDPWRDIAGYALLGAGR